MRIIKFFLFILAFQVFRIAQATQLTPEELEVKAFAEAMYSYDPATFENGEFDSQLRPYTKNYPPNKSAKYRPAEHCNLLKTMFTESMLPVDPKGKTCYLPDRWISRFPNIAEEDLAPEGRAPGPFKERFTLSHPAVKGEKAKIAVFTKEARNLLFLTKTNQGWKVSNAMVHWVWPDLDDGTHHCFFKFVLPPSPDEKLEILPHCRH